MRDVADNFVVICSIENIDPMGVHTGDSITVAPILTLTDKEYQRMRDAARLIIRKVGVETGEVEHSICDQPGQRPDDRHRDEPARLAIVGAGVKGDRLSDREDRRKLALGYHLDEIPNDITRVTPASFEPTIDYVVVKIPRWNFEKFPQADRTLTTQMQSVGEAMAIGRTFKEAFMKGVRSLELGRSGLLFAPSPADDEDDGALRKRLAVPTDRRMWDLFRALSRGWSVEQIHTITKIDPWFVQQFAEIRDMQAAAAAVDSTARWPGDPPPRSAPGSATPAGLATGRRNRTCATARVANIKPVYKRVDTCAAEFESLTPYLYSSHEPTW
jgi:carbamoyl-phosphate synthase large subunit